MRFSVIIPVYNSAPFLHKCIDSLVSQAYQDYELILVDDGSTDNSYDICVEYAYRHSNVQVYRQENSGPSITRNNGIKKATGDYILFVDSDDWVSRDYFSVLDEAIKDKPDIVFFGMLHPKDKRNSEKKYPDQEIKGTSNIVQFIAENYGIADTHSCLNKCYSKKLFQSESVNFPNKTVVEEDLLFVLRVSEVAETAFSISNVLYHYNQRESGSVTTKYNPDKFDCKVEAYKEELTYSKRWNNKRLEIIFQDNFLTYISSCINNLMYKECTLDKEQKIKEIRRFYENENTQECVKNAICQSMRSKIMKRLVRGRCYRLSYFMHASIIRAMGR